MDLTPPHYPGLHPPCNPRNYNVKLSFKILNLLLICILHKIQNFQIFNLVHLLFPGFGLFGMFPLKLGQCNLSFLHCYQLVHHPDLL